MLPFVLGMMLAVSQVHQHGVELYGRKQYAAAISVLEDALKTETPESPEYKESVLLIGQSYFMLSQATKAIPWLEKAPNSNEANYMLGYAYLQANDRRKSEVAFARLFEVKPDSAAGHLLAAQMMLKKDYDAEAVLEAKAALALNANLPEAHFLLGEVAIYRGDLDGGIQELQQELALNPNFSMAWYRLGDAYTRKENWDLAIPNLQRAVWLNPEFSGPYILLGKSYLKKAEYANAEGILRRAVELDPNNQSAKYLLGQALIAAGKKEEGRAILEKLREAQGGR